MTAHEHFLQVRDLSVRFPIHRSILQVLSGKKQKYLTAVDHVSLNMNKGETLGLVGESGCGKSSLARAIIGLYPLADGQVIFSDTVISEMSHKERRRQAGKIQMVFQDPYSSLNPRMSVRTMLREALLQHHICLRKDVDQRIAELLSMVGLSDEYADRLPADFSGGQRQRIGIARALALNPQVIIADEPVSALDVSIQAQIINLLSDLQKQLDLTMLFISHDLQVVRYISDRIAVMYLGAIMEYGPAEEVFQNPLHPYTKVLLNAAPKMTREARETKTREAAIRGDLPSPVNLPAGCRFHPRCRFASDLCRTKEPEIAVCSAGHYCACHLHTGGTGNVQTEQT